MSDKSISPIKYKSLSQIISQSNFDVLNLLGRFDIDKGQERHVFVIVSFGFLGRNYEIPTVR